MEKFLGNITRHLSEQYDIRTCYNGNNKTLNDAIAWADIIWVEWANELAVALTHGLPLGVNKRVICRLHSYEAFASFPDQIKWERIDDLIFVAPHIRNYMLSRVPELKSRTSHLHVIPNGVDMARFPLKIRRPGKNLAFLGYINYKKGPMLLLHALAELVRQDPTYRLFIGGTFQDERYRLYFEHMATELGIKDNIRFDGWIDDVPSWLDDKQYIVCSSVLEAHPVGIMEAMACGVKPVVHNFVGARTVFDSRFVWNTIDEFANMIQSDEYNSESYHVFTAENYSLQRQLASVNNMMLQDCQVSVTNK
jgi:glycosyltransferase involved in cell wall biosynthesis